MPASTILRNVGKSLSQDLARPVKMISTFLGSLRYGGHRFVSTRLFTVLLIILVLAAFEVLYLHLVVKHKIKDQIFKEADLLVRSNVKDMFAESKSVDKQFVHLATGLKTYNQVMAPQVDGILEVAAGFEKTANRTRQLTVSLTEILVIGGLVAAVLAISNLLKNR